MPGCAVATCNNSFAKTRSARPDVSYHRFPKNPHVRDQWVEFCRRHRLWNPATGYICSDHFTVDDFVRDLRGEILGTRTKKCLKPNAVPTLQNKLSESPSARCRRARIEKRKEAESRAKVVKEALDNYEMERRHLEQELLEQEIINTCLVNAEKRRAQLERRQVAEDDLVKSALDRLVDTVLEDTLDDVNLYQMYVDTVKESRRLQEASKKLLKSGGGDDSGTGHVVLDEAQQVKTDNFYAVLSQALSKVLTPNQIALVLNPGKKVKWTSTEMSRAFSLRCLSTKAYMYLKKELNYPLPGLAYLKRWAARNSQTLK